MLAFNMPTIAITDIGIPTDKQNDAIINAPTIPVLNRMFLVE